MSIQLRPYQTETLEAIVSAFAAGVGHQIVHLPTADKTVGFASMIAQAANYWNGINGLDVNRLKTLDYARFKKDGFCRLFSCKKRKRSLRHG